MSRKQYLRKQKILAIILVIISGISAYIANDSTAFIMCLMIAIAVFLEKE